MSILPYKILHAFSTSPNCGNPAAVVLLPPATNVPQDADASTLASLYPADSILQATATASNQPMTGFALPLSSPQPSQQSFVLRWFNPVTEAWLCGHATMAASSLLFAKNPSWTEVAYQTMKYGKIVARRNGEAVSMDFPELTELEQLGADQSGRYCEAIQAAAKGWDEAAVLEVWDSEDRVLVELNSEFDLATLEVDCKQLTIVMTQVVPKERGVKEQLRSRVFVIMPGFEHEDQVVSHGWSPDRDKADSQTGSAHCLIIPYFQTRQGAQERFRAAAPSEEDGEGNAVVRCRQVSPGSGELSVTWRKTEGKVRIMGVCHGAK